MLANVSDVLEEHVEAGPQPPVNEVVLSVKLVRQPVLSGPLLPDILGDWFEKHSQVQVVPVYQMPQESPDFGGLTSLPQIQLIGTMAEPRYWLTSADDTELIQVQPDYLALNWRRKSPAQEYVGFAVLERRFRELLRVTDDGLKRHGGMLQPSQCELTYINLITPNRLWSRHSEMRNIFNVAIANDRYDNAAVTYSRALGGNDNFLGRLHVAIQSTFDWPKREPQLNLSITVRSADMDDTNIESALSFLNEAHDFAGEAFLELLTDAARQMWSLK